MVTVEGAFTMAYSMHVQYAEHYVNPLVMTKLSFCYRRHWFTLLLHPEMCDISIWSTVF